MALSEILLFTNPREKAGSETDKRYNYQKDLSLYMLIDFHQSKDDYVMLFDYHDDIAVLDSESNPKKIEFYQVKTKGTGHWLLSDLLRRKEGKLSILGKLYKNRINFEDYTDKLVFITNTSIKIQLNNGKDSISLTDFKGDDLNDVVITKINQKLKGEHSLDHMPSFEGITFFKVHCLSLNDSSTHCTGALNVLFEKLNPNYSGNTYLAYKKIFNEIKIRTDRVLDGSSQAPDLEQIIQEKGISKKAFDEIIRVAGLYRNADKVWADIHVALNSAGASVSEIKKYKQCWRETSIRILNQQTNIPLKKTIEYINEIVTFCQNQQQYSSLNIIRFVDAVEGQCNNLPFDIFDETFIKGAILNAIYND